MQFTVNIEEIRDRGLVWARELPEVFLEEALAGETGGQTAFHCVGPGRFEGRFERNSGRVLLNGKLTLKVKGECKRCLTEVTTALEVPVAMSFVTQRKDQPGREEDAEQDERKGQHDERQGSFELDEADVETFDGQRIELGDVLREQVLLNLPMEVLCKADCKGLCASCGQDRNLRDCGHEQKVPDPRWAALKDIKLKN